MAETISKKNIIFQVKLDTTDIKKGVKNIQSETKKAKKGIDSFTNSIKGVGAAIGIAFGTAQLISFSKQALKAAAAAEGIKNAFDKINDPQLLINLRKAVRGTVDDVRLMRAAVQARNFKIPLENLAKFFEFAASRARDTGESVDFLVESIINGIGRRSALVLDNLGISATEISAEFRKTGDFAQAAANIIERDMAAAGESVSTMADDLQRINVAWVNFTRAFGGIIGGVLRNLDTQAGLYGQVAEAAKALQVENRGFIDDFLQAEPQLTGAGESLLETYRQLKIETAEAARRNRILANTFIVAQTEIVKTEEEMDLLWQTIIRNQPAAAETLGEMELRLKKLNEELRNLVPHTDEYNAKLKELEQLQRDIDKALGKTNDSLAEQRRRMQELSDVFDAWAMQLESDLGPNLRHTADEIADITTLAERLAKVLRDLAGVDFTVDLPEETFPDEDKDLDDFEKKKKKEKEIAEALEEAKRDAAIRGLQEVGEFSSAIADRRIQDLENALSQGLISEEEFAQRTAEIRQKQAAADKAFTIFGIILNTALGIQKTIGNLGFPAAIPFVAIAAALGAAQLATAIAQPVPQFAEGEIDIHRPGEKRGKDSIAAHLMPGESVMTSKETQMHKPLLEAIRAGNLEDYIYRAYISPSILNQVGGFDDRRESKYNDYQLRLAVKNNKRVELGNDTIRKMASELGYQLRPKYR